MRRDHESLVVIDPWDAYVHLEATLEENDREHDRFDTGATLEQFKENYLRFRAQLPDIRQGVSTEQLKHLPAGRFRFIHIDGSHEWRVVSADVGQVLRILSPGGVVAFDDVFDRRFAGIGAAVWPVCGRGDLVPLATTDKLSATRGPSRVSAAYPEEARRGPVPARPLADPRRAEAGGRLRAAGARALTPGAGDTPPWRAQATR